MPEKTEYTISKVCLDRVLKTLSDYWFSENGEYNNDDVIDAHKELTYEMENQDEDLARDDESHAGQE